ncbi:MAG: hypothetical protein DRP55_08800 [Spirochaetes bacterium]|nr:MAG: hypothetical protein DRP55_08800 [Spirochaetota bacterium]
MKSNNFVFKPRFSPLPFFIHTALSSYFLYLLHSALFEVSNIPVKIVLLIISVPFAFIPIFLIAIYPTMRYELRDDGLHLICGPFKEKINYKEIRRIFEKDLKYDISSTGWKIPGYALFKIFYKDLGWVKMYSTRVLKNILIIETFNGNLFGITPKEKNRFLLSLKKFLSDESIISVCVSEKSEIQSINSLPIFMIISSLLISFIGLISLFISPNPFIGIRTSKTVTNPILWKKVNTVGGIGFIIIGLVFSFLFYRIFKLKDEKGKTEKLSKFFVAFILTTFIWVTFSILFIYIF